MNKLGSMRHVPSPEVGFAALSDGSIAGKRLLSAHLSASATSHFRPKEVAAVQHAGPTGFGASCMMIAYAVAACVVHTASAVPHFAKAVQLSPTKITTTIRTFSLESSRKNKDSLCAADAARCRGLAFCCKMTIIM